MCLNSGLHSADAAGQLPAASTGEGGQRDAQGLLVAGPLHTDVQGERGGSSLHLVFVIPCQSLIINIILEWATEAPGEEGMLG